MNTLISSNMIIAKFGGTSVSSKENILNITQIVKNEIKRQPVVVVSALSGVTDLLLSLPALTEPEKVERIQKIKSLHQDLINGIWQDRNSEKVLGYIEQRIEEIIKLLKGFETSKSALDKLVSFGEIMSSFIVSQALEKQGIKAEQVIATHLIVTDDNFGGAEFMPDATKENVKQLLVPILKEGIIPVVTGFIGQTEGGRVTTLGRGGSDYTASILGFSLNAEEVQIWTDVDGIFTSDPKVVKNAKKIEQISYKEASELAAFGAKVLHPRTIHPAIEENIPVRVLNTFNPNNSGTLISRRNNTSESIKAISFKRNITLVNVYSEDMLLQKGFLARIFQVFANNGISVDLVSASEVSISVTLDNDENLHTAYKQLSQFSTVTIGKDLGMVSLIGEGVTNSSNTIRRIFDILDEEKIKIKMVSLGATNINISLVLENNLVESAVNALHGGLIL